MRPNAKRIFTLVIVVALVLTALIPLITVFIK